MSERNYPWWAAGERSKPMRDISSGLIQSIKSPSSQKKKRAEEPKSRRPSGIQDNSFRDFLQRRKQSIQSLRTQKKEASPRWEKPHTLQLWTMRKPENLDFQKTQIGTRPVEALRDNPRARCDTPAEVVLPTLQASHSGDEKAQAPLHRRPSSLLRPPLPSQEIWKSI